MPKLLSIQLLKQCLNYYQNNHSNDAQIVAKIIIRMITQQKTMKFIRRDPALHAKSLVIYLPCCGHICQHISKIKIKKLRFWRSSSSQLRKIVRESVLDTNLAWYCLSRITPPPFYGLSRSRGAVQAPRATGPAKLDPLLVMECTESVCFNCKSSIQSEIPKDSKWFVF